MTKKEMITITSDNLFLLRESKIIKLPLQNRASHICFLKIPSESNIKEKGLSLTASSFILMTSEADVSSETFLLRFAFAAPRY